MCRVCPEPVRSEGLCQIHYKRQLRNGHPEALLIGQSDALYVVRGRGLVKPGITCGTMAARLGIHRRNGLSEVLFTRSGLAEGVARKAEQQVLRQLRQRGAVPVEGLEYFPESWTDVVLQLIAGSL